MTIIAVKNMRNGSVVTASAHQVSAQKAERIMEHLNMSCYQTPKNHRWRVVNLDDYSTRGANLIQQVAEGQTFSITKDGRLIERRDLGMPDYY